MYKQAQEQAATRAQEGVSVGMKRASRWSLYLPALFVLAVALWAECLPVFSGAALAAATFAAVVLLVRYRVAPRGERVFWCAAVVLLCVAELGVALRAHQGTKSFLVGQLTPDGQLRVAARGSLKIRSGMLFVVDWDRLSALKAAHVIDAERYQHLIQAFPLGDMAPGASQVLGIRPIAPEDGTAHYRLIFSAMNGSWWEDLDAREAKGRVLQDLRVIRYRDLRPAVLYAYEQAGFRDGGQQPDWRWASEAP